MGLNRFQNDIDANWFTGEFNKFMFSNMSISYAYLLSVIAGYIKDLTLLHFISKIIVQLPIDGNAAYYAGKFFITAFWLQALSVADFFLIYEDSFATILNYNVQYTDIKNSILCFYGLRLTWYVWKSTI